MILFSFMESTREGRHSSTIFFPSQCNVFLSPFFSRNQTREFYRDGMEEESHLPFPPSLPFVTSTSTPPLPPLLPCSPPFHRSPFLHPLRSQKKVMDKKDRPLRVANTSNILLQLAINVSTLSVQSPLLHTVSVVVFVLKA